jgi:hypothetical protein
MTNEIENAIDAHAAHDLADELASAGVTATRSGWPNSDEACEIAGYGRVVSRDGRWVVQATDGHDYPIDNNELAAELDEIIKMTKQVS